MVASPEVPRNAEGAKGRPRCRKQTEVENNAANNASIIKAGTPRRNNPDLGRLGSCIAYRGGLSTIRAAVAGSGLYDLDLVAGTGVLDKVPHVDDAIGAGVGAL
jgi:hypothetical protein